MERKHTEGAIWKIQSIKSPNLEIRRWQKKKKNNRRENIWKNLHMEKERKLTEKKERKKDRKKEIECVCVCVRKRERQRKRETEREREIGEGECKNLNLKKTPPPKKRTSFLIFVFFIGYIYSCQNIPWISSEFTTQGWRIAYDECNKTWREKKRQEKFLHGVEENIKCQVKRRESEASRVTFSPR